MKTFKIIPSQPSYEISVDGVIRKVSNKRIKSQYIGSTGYYMITVTKQPGSRSQPLRVHRLLAEVYLPNPQNLPEINHKNGIKTDNSIENIEWCSTSENIRHAFRTGLANNTGEKNGKAKLKKEQVYEIKKLLTSGMSQYKIAAMFPVSRSTILGIKLGRLWSHV